MNIQQIIIIIACFGAALLLIFRMGKENRAFYYAGGMFGLIGAFYLVQELWGDLLKSPVYTWIFRIVMLVLLVYLCYVYYQERKISTESSKKDDQSGDGGSK